MGIITKYITETSKSEISDFTTPKINININS